MNELLGKLTTADYRFLSGIIESSLNLSDDTEIARLITAFEEEANHENRVVLCTRLENEIRYLGSSEIAYGLRYVTGRDPGSLVPGNRPRRGEFAQGRCPSDGHRQ